MCFLYWGAQRNTVCRWGPAGAGWEDDPSPQAPGCAPPSTAQDAIGHLCCQGTLLMHRQGSACQEFSVKPVSPSLPCVQHNPSITLLWAIFTHAFGFPPIQTTVFSGTNVVADTVKSPAKADISVIHWLSLVHKPSHLITENNRFDQKLFTFSKSKMTRLYEWDGTWWTPESQKCF